jgi:hypothetical protein
MNHFLRSNIIDFSIVRVGKGLGGAEVRGQRSVVSGQWSEVSGQWSVVRGQWSVVSGQRSEKK